MSVEENIISGPPLDWAQIYKGSLTEYLYEQWLKLPRHSALLIDGNTSEVFTVEQVLTKSLQIRDGLINLGLKQNDRVLICGQNEANLIISQYGILFAGGVPSPVDYNLKIHELKHFRGIIEPKVVICDKQTLKNCQIIFPDSLIILNVPCADNSSTPALTQFYNRQVDINNFKPPVADPDDVAVIAPSSGSTGLPKGVGLRHRGIIIMIYYWQHIYKFERLLQLTQLFWISAIIPTYFSICKGICRVFLREFNEEAIFKAIDVYKIETVFIIPYNIISLCTHPKARDYDLSSVDRFHTGATPVFQVHYDLIKTCFGSHVKPFNIYGATELGAFVNITEPWSLSIGSLLPGIQLKVVDSSTQKSLGAGETGELIYKSPAIMAGYINNDEATKAALDDGGWYYTGDQGHYDEDGVMYVTGRLKEIFKFRAAHVSPSDIENVIQEIPGVEDVGVAGIPHPKDVNQPIALVVRNPDKGVTSELIMNKVEEKLAASRRLEAGVRFVEAIPRTTTGKIKRIELQKLALSLY